LMRFWSIVSSAPRAVPWEIMQLRISDRVATEKNIERFIICFIAIIPFQRKLIYIVEFTWSGFLL